MKNPPSSEDLLKNVQTFLENQGYQRSEKDEKTLEKIMEMLAKSRNTQAAFYDWEPPHGAGFLRKVKNGAQRKLKNVILNTLEKYVMRQQKYNELVYQCLMELQHENNRLHELLQNTTEVKSSQNGN